MSPRSLCIDLEAVSCWDALPEAAQSAILLRHSAAEARLPLELRAQAANDPRERAALSPWTGRVVSVALFDPEAERGRCFYDGEGVDTETISEGGWRFEPQNGEPELLRTFWSVLAQNPDSRIVGFNSRSYDGPFLSVRSFVQNIRITRSLSPYRYSTERCLDLYDVLGFWGASRCPALEIVTEAVGIPSPKSDISGKDVEAAWRRGERLRVARYNARDAEVLAALESRWADTVEPHFTERRKYG